MRIPAVLFGRAAEVEQRVPSWTRMRLADGTWDDDSLDAAAPLLLGPPSPDWQSVPSFHPFMPALDVTRAVVEEDLSPLVEQATFERWLTIDWALAGLLAPVNVTWLRQPARYRPFLDAAIERWDALSSVGAGYSDGGSALTGLWDLPVTVKYVLANMGLDPARLRSPLPPGGLAELAADVAHWDGVPVVERWP